ncbi:MAG: hypothetical protein PVJ67_05085 [Candidatus Pacearchaeota archaeon]|jgi:hypothetical protein
MFDLTLLDDLTNAELDEVLKYIHDKKKKTKDIFGEFLDNYVFEENKKYTTKSLYKDFEKHCKDKKKVCPMIGPFTKRLIKFKEDNPEKGKNIEI